MPGSSSLFSFFFFNDTATTEIYTLSLHDALPICLNRVVDLLSATADLVDMADDYMVEKVAKAFEDGVGGRSEEHTSELQSPDHLVCRLLLEKKKKNKTSVSRQLEECHDCCLKRAI